MRVDFFFTARQIADPDRFHNGGEADFLPEYPVDQRLHLIGGPARFQLHKQSQNIPAVQVVDHDLVLARRAVDPAEQFVDLAGKMFTPRTLTMSSVRPRMVSMRG